MHARLCLAVVALLATGGILSATRTTREWNTPTALAHGIERRSLQSISLAADVPEPVAPPVIGNKPWIVLRCAFPDQSWTIPGSWSAFFSDEYALGYWREVSYGAISIAGSHATRSYTLPHPVADYTTPGEDQPSVSSRDMERDCLAAADGDVYFPDYYGISFVYALQTDRATGGLHTLNLDGQSRTYGATWTDEETSGGNIQLHEMGHAFGLPHSLDSGRWDLMAGGFGHMIAYHKEVLGWIPPERIFTLSANSQAQITLERLAVPPPSGYLMARIPIPGGTHFYTVEARRWAGFDDNLSDEAVLIFEVDPTRYEPAHLVKATMVPDPAQQDRWTPGMVFVDPTSNITICVLAEASTGYAVALGAGVTPDCHAGNAALQVRANSGQLLRRSDHTYATYAVDLYNAGVGVSHLSVVADTPRLTGRGEDSDAHLCIVEPTGAIERSHGCSQGVWLDERRVQFASDSLAYHLMGHLVLSVQVADGLTGPNALSMPFHVSWDGGSLETVATVIANPLQVFLPMVSSTPDEGVLYRPRLSR